MEHEFLINGAKAYRTNAIRTTIMFVLVAIVLVCFLIIPIARGSQQFINHQECDGSMLLAYIALAVGLVSVLDKSNWTLAVLATIYTFNVQACDDPSFISFMEGWLIAYYVIFGTIWLVSMLCKK